MNEKTLERMRDYTQKYSQENVMKYQETDHFEEVGQIERVYCKDNNDKMNKILECGLPIAITVGMVKRLAFKFQSYDEATGVIKSKCNQTAQEIRNNGYFEHPLFDDLVQCVNLAIWENIDNIQLVYNKTRNNVTNEFVRIKKTVNKKQFTIQFINSIERVIPCYNMVYTDYVLNEKTGHMQSPTSLSIYRAIGNYLHMNGQRDIKKAWIEIDSDYLKQDPSKYETMFMHDCKELKEVEAFQSIEKILSGTEYEILMLKFKGFTNKEVCEKMGYKSMTSLDRRLSHIKEVIIKEYDSDILKELLKCKKNPKLIQTMSLNHDMTDKLF